MGEASIATLRAQATEKFRRHIERWLQNTRQRLPRRRADSPHRSAGHWPRGTRSGHPRQPRTRPRRRKRACPAHEQAANG